jgi:hypothetical protein
MALKTCGWEIIENPPTRKGTDKHICPGCVKKNKNLIKSIKIYVDRGNKNDKDKYLDICSKCISPRYFKDVEKYCGITPAALKKLIENFEFEKDKGE